MSTMFREFGGRPYLFAWTKKYSGERTYHVLVEDDLNYLVGVVFDQFFDVGSKRIYQVVDENGDPIYGPEGFEGMRKAGLGED